MITKKIVLLAVSVLLLIIIIGSILFVDGIRTKNIIEDKLQIRLPGDVHIIKYTTQNDEVYAKIKLSENDISIIKDRYNQDDYALRYGFYYYDDEYNPDFRENIPGFSPNPGWWDLSQKDIVFCYNIYNKTGSYWVDFKQQLGVPGMTWIFITNDSKGDKYLYLAQYVTEKSKSSDTTNDRINSGHKPAKTRPATDVFKAAVMALINEDYSSAGSYVNIPDLSAEDSKKLWTEIFQKSAEYDPATDKLSSIQIIGEQGYENGSTTWVVFKSHFKKNGDTLHYAELHNFDGKNQIFGLSKGMDSVPIEFEELLRDGHLPNQ